MLKELLFYLSMRYTHLSEPVAEKAPGTPAGLAAIAMKLLEKQPEARYQRGHDVSDALYQWIASQGERDEPPVRATRPASAG